MASAVMLWLGAGNLLSRGHTPTRLSSSRLSRDLMWMQLQLQIQLQIQWDGGSHYCSIGSHRPGCLGLLTAWQVAPGANSGACGMSTHKNNCCFIPTSTACPCLQGMPVCSILSGPFSAQNNSKGKICPLKWGPLGWMPPPMTERVALALASYIALCLLQPQQGTWKEGLQTHLQPQQGTWKEGFQRWENERWRGRRGGL